MAKIANIESYRVLLKKIFDNKEKEFVMYNKKVIYMSVHIYPMILHKKIVKDKTRYSAESMFDRR